MLLASACPALFSQHSFHFSECGGLAVGPTWCVEGAPRIEERGWHLSLASEVEGRARWTQYEELKCGKGTGVRTHPSTLLRPPNLSQTASPLVPAG